jgi:DNA-binding LacI/PurR family transcriptional regulator
MVNLAISHLVSLGHQRIMLCTCRGSRYFDLLSQYYREGMASYGYASDAREWYLDAYPAEDRIEILKEFAGPHPPTALLVEETSRARQLVKILSDNNWPVPERVSVLVISSRVNESDGLSSILGSTRDLLLRGVAMLGETIQQSEKVSRIEKIVAKFVPGRTVARPS